jgi:antitoxin VapB
VPFTIDDPDIERLARDLAAATGEPMPRALAAALRERLERVRQLADGRADVRAPATAARPFSSGPERPVLGSVAEIQAYLAALPDLDPRTPDEILGYDAAGLPH